MTIFQQLSLEEVTQSFQFHCLNNEEEFLVRGENRHLEENL